MRLLPVGTLILWVVAGAGAILAVDHSWILAAVCVFLASVATNSTMLTLHEAVHRTLTENPRLNDALGVAVGVLLVTPFSAYKFVHMSHHGMLGSERDLEFWPYVDRRKSLFVRRLTAVTELLASPITYGILFSRVALKQLLPASIVRRIRWEYALIGVIWVPVLAGIAITGTWVPFILAFVIPLWLGANMQSWRRLIEHLGLTGDDTLSMTRTVIATNPIERLYSLIMMHENYHGPHHSKGRVPWQSLPAMTREMYPPGSPQRALLFRSYLTAVPHMLKALARPEIGPQWRH